MCYGSSHPKFQRHEITFWPAISTILEKYVSLVLLGTWNEQQICLTSAFKHNTSMWHNLTPNVAWHLACYLQTVHPRSRETSPQSVRIILLSSDISMHDDSQMCHAVTHLCGRRFSSACSILWPVPPHGTDSPHRKFLDPFQSVLDRTSPSCSMKQCLPNIKQCKPSAVWKLS